MANGAEGQENQRDYIIQKATVVSFQGSIASFRAIQQGVVCTMWPYSAKGPSSSSSISTDQQLIIVVIRKIWQQHKNSQIPYM